VKLDDQVRGLQAAVDSDRCIAFQAFFDLMETSDAEIVMPAEREAREPVPRVANCTSPLGPGHCADAQFRDDSAFIINVNRVVAARGGAGACAAAPAAPEAARNAWRDRRGRSRRRG
jgi:hypothetical protein